MAWFIVLPFAFQFRMKSNFDCISPSISSPHSTPLYTILHFSFLDRKKLNIKNCFFVQLFSIKIKYRPIYTHKHTHTHTESYIVAPCTSIYSMSSFFSSLLLRCYDLYLIECDCRKRLAVKEK